MVTLNCSVEDGGGYIHLISSEEVNLDEVGSWDMVEAQCGFMLEPDSTLCDARDAGRVLWKGQPFHPDDLADLILRLRRDAYMCRECVREHFEAVGGISGLYHDKWTEDLHREDRIEPPDSEERLHTVTAKTTVDGVEIVMTDDHNIMVNGDCPTCTNSSRLHVTGLEANPGQPIEVVVRCATCNNWSESVTFER